MSSMSLSYLKFGGSVGVMLSRPQHAQQDSIRDRQLAPHSQGVVCVNVILKPRLWKKNQGGPTAQQIQNLRS